MFTSLRVVTQPQIEPVSTDLARQHIRVDFHEDDALIGMYVTTARTMVEAWLNRALITQTLQWTMTETPAYGASPLVSSPLVAMPPVGSWAQYFSRPLELPRAPVQSMTSVTLRDYFDTDIVMGVDQYSVDLLIDPASLRILPTSIPAPTKHISVVYVAGYGLDEASTPAPIRHAILMLTAMLYERRGDDGGDWPGAVMSLLTPYRLISFGG